jgi:two-component system, OmpR family, sensor histidine kinase KdpD
VACSSKKWTWTACLHARPKLVLVDELAHSNAPGSRHAKRWQDVQELLAAGIDVYTTVNVQHLESLNDQVRGITGVQVRETLPDWVVQEAYELLLIDLPPRELLERLREGKVYVPEQARAAIDAFFTQTNLNALRELAMQTAAVYVDDELDKGYRQLGQAAPALRGRLLVGVDGDLHRPSAWCVTPAGWPSAGICRGAWCMWTTARCATSSRGCACKAPSNWPSVWGARWCCCAPGEVAKTLIQHAAERRASLLLVGQSRPTWRRKCSVAAWRSRLLRDAHGLEINVLDNEQSAPPCHAASRVGSLVWFDYGLALLATVLASALAWGVSSVLALPNISLVFLAAVLLVAVRSSLGPALACAALSFLTYDFLFIPPNFSFSIQREEDVLTLLFFLLMAALDRQPRGPPASPIAGAARHPARDQRIARPVAQTHRCHRPQGGGQCRRPAFERLERTGPVPAQPRWQRRLERGGRRAVDLQPRPSAPPPTGPGATNSRRAKAPVPCRWGVGGGGR